MSIVHCIQALSIGIVRILVKILFQKLTEWHTFCERYLSLEKILS